MQPQQYLVSIGISAALKIQIVEGEMAKFLSTKGIEAEIDNIIRQAKKRIVVISPFVRMSGIFRDRLCEAVDRGVQVDLVFGIDKLHPVEESRLSQITGMKVHFLENLHAKAFINETASVITSMNFYEARKTANYEMGVLLTQSDDPEAYADACAEVKSILRSAEQQNFRPVASADGHCIRCGEQRQFNPDLPLCRACFSIWAEYGDEYYPERKCHKCGQQREVSMRKPLCWDCYSVVF